MIVLWEIYEREWGCGLNQITHSKRPAQKYINPRIWLPKRRGGEGPSRTNEIKGELGNANKSMAALEKVLP